MMIRPIIESNPFTQHLKSELYLQVTHPQLKETAYNLIPLYSYIRHIGFYWYARPRNYW